MDHRSPRPRMVTLRKRRKKKKRREEEDVLHP
jgi:hypothetical protein